MDVATQVPELRATVTSACQILTDSDSAEFQEYTKRWSDIDRQIPAAIVLPTTEEDIQRTVQWAVKRSIPFVTRSGGHSEWSTIGSQGFVVDLSLYSSIQVHKEAHTVTLKGSVLAKPLAVALAGVGLFTALGNGNTVGVIPYLLGGGVSVTNSITGFGSDQIISARMITAEGKLIEVNEQFHADLLWAVRGAGQFFGLITELVVQAYPFSELGNERGVLWTGSFVFPLARAKEVAVEMKALMDDGSRATAGLMMMVAPPPHRNPSLVIAARYTGNPADAESAYKPLYDLKPLVATGNEIPIANASDGREAVGAKGDFKRFGVVGLQRFDVDAFLETIDVWKGLIAECPDAINTAFMFQWDSRFAKAPNFDSATCLHDIRYWQNNLIWHTDVENRSKVDAYNDRSIAVMRGLGPSELVDYPNATRGGPIELRYRGQKRLKKLQRLKREWDPTGVFTKQLMV